MTQRYLVSHTHEYGVTPYFVESSVDLLALDPDLLEEMCSDLEIDFEPEKETIDITQIYGTHFTKWEPK